MKIAFIGQKGVPAKSGGVDRHVESLAYFLAKNSQEVFVYNRRGYLDVEMKEWNAVKLISKPFIDNKNLAAITHGFLSVIDAMIRKVDVIHFHGIGPSLLAWIPKIFTPKIKIVATLHSFDYGNDKWGTFAKFMLKLGEKVMSKYADEVIVLTALMRDYLYQRHGRDSVVIPNGAFIQESKGDSSLAQFKIESGKYIVSISRLIRLKGIQYLIESFKELKKEKRIPSDLKLVIVGDGEYEGELKKIAAKDKNIIFTGNQSGDILAELYANAALFVQSSEMEGLSISLLEAMAYGLPILASDISANREASGDTAFYFPAKDQDALSIALELIFKRQDEAIEAGKRAKERVEKHFNWSDISLKTLELYRKK